ncbi:helix-turn-helix protein [Kribbella sp. VKM Ac-2571]|uniref:helix-turn-helix transcriptional regulator n=1 Tax=Kribbella sp. VKM Ac-2571 TaxID=2512222 RepID=UPI00105FF793|nr:helix-turn-helix transcriptional regulator [Kribbella sp. VKM Ac-2571]TDO64127.1 helix-turn-helix protein [Kribbella sp. VKM Ac-2571]
MHPWIENVTLQAPTTPITVLPPDPATTVVWRMTRAGESDVLIAGPRTKAAYHTSKDLPVCLRLRIRPGRALPLLGAAADELVDRTVPLSDLTGPSANALAGRLASYKDEPEQAAAVLGDFLLGRLPRRLPDRLELVGEAAAELGAGGAPRTVGETAQRLGVSERYLRRVFREAVGVSPKHFARITRVRTVIAQARRSWSDAAACAGYTDQSHLIADFRSLMRVTPEAYATGRVPLSTC